MTWYVPITPGGTPVPYGAGSLMGKQLASKSKEQAIKNLVKDAEHMPYGTWENFQARGYTIEEWPDSSLS